MSHLIKDTTKEERKKLAKNAFGISIASNERPSNETISLVKEYINGKMELEDIYKQIINKYKREGF